MSFPLTSPVEITGTALDPGEIRLTSDANVLALKMSSAVSGTVNLTLPETEGNSGDVIKNDGSGASSWEKQSVLIAISLMGSDGVPAVTSSLTYAIFSSVVFRDGPSFTKFIAIVSASAIGVTGEIDVQDALAATSIGGTTFSGINSKTIVEFDIVPPSSQTYLDVQLRTNTPGSVVQMYYFQICRP